MDDLAIYIHWPYCSRICPYCDFNVYKQAGEDAALVSAIVQDLSYWREWSGPRHVSSIHFGGGTPSLMAARDVAVMIDKVCALWTPRPDIEIAMEANPNDMEAARWQGFHKAGVNRLSLGIQSFQGQVLKALGRAHGAEQAHEAVAMAVQIFPSVSLDLIFGWAGQSEAQWADDLRLAARSGAEHISAYQLTIEEGTPFARSEARGRNHAVDEAQSARLYEQAEDYLTGAGYAHYEISNYAKPGAHSRHNLSYWRGQDYVGAGPGAHGRLTIEGQKFATIAALKPGDYIALCRTDGHGISERIALTDLERAEEYVLMGLRITEGFSQEYFETLAGQPLPQERLGTFIKDGYLEQTGDKIAASRKGRLVLNYLTQQLLSGL